MQDPKNLTTATPEALAPDALDPHVLSEELTNIMYAHTGGKLSRDKCAKVVQLQLAKLAAYYAAALGAEMN